MAYYITLFSPKTYEAFGQSDRNISGVLEKQRPTAALIRPGDKLICYMTKLSRWIGVFEVKEPYFIDDTPIFVKQSDPYCVRFPVKTLVWLAPEYGIPINQDICWKHLSFTRSLPKKSRAWTAMVRSSLRKLENEDGEYLESQLIQQLQNPHTYPLTDTDKKKLEPLVVNSIDNRQITVSVPDDEAIRSPRPQQAEQRESTKIQAKLAELGETMRFQIWLPRNDRQRVLEVWNPEDQNTLLEHLPINYDNVTLKTIENIDVLRIRRHSIVRAFEVEHTTSVYSGILRMADLVALQPNLAIKAHIVAPLQRREKVLQEISRPVFALLERGPLSEFCSYISYDAVLELMEERHLEHLNDTVLEDYAEFAEEADI